MNIILIPRIMGKAYNMNPPIILLSLSIWGSVTGLLGMLPALPLITLFISYYRRLIIEEPILHYSQIIYSDVQLSAKYNSPQ